MCHDHLLHRPPSRDFEYSGQVPYRPFSRIVLILFALASAAACRTVASSAPPVTQILQPGAPGQDTNRDESVANSGDDHAPTSARTPNNVGAATTLRALQGLGQCDPLYDREVTVPWKQPCTKQDEDGRSTQMSSADADRRRRVRFEVFGSFWGTLDVPTPVMVRELSLGGALIEADQPLAVESVQSICLILDGQPTLSNARVRHLRTIEPFPRARHLVGLEFLAASSAFLEAVEEVLGSRSFPAEPA